MKPRDRLFAAERRGGGRRKWWWLAVLLAALAFPPQWYPYALRVQLSKWFGAAGFRGFPASTEVDAGRAEPFCTDANPEWGKARTVGDIDIRAAVTCAADNPWAVAASVIGTNNVLHSILMRSGLTPDAVVKGDDLDGDGDPDEIHIRLEVAELNGSSAESRDPVTQYAIAPGVKPGMWVFAPKLAGMARENFESVWARSSLRLPSPAIRVEQGDRVTVTLGEQPLHAPHPAPARGRPRLRDR